MKKAMYDEIGEGYSQHRRADPRIVDAIVDLLAVPPGSFIADVGAGTGTYSGALAQRGYAVKAIEPSEVMRSQAQLQSGIEWIPSSAEKIPLPTGSVAAAIGILSFHHFGDPVAGLDEMARISRGGTLLLFTFDPREVGGFWFAEYFADIWTASFRVFPPIGEVSSMIAASTNATTTIQPFDLPGDLMDCFAAAGWCNPEMYLDASIRSSISAFAVADAGVVENSVRRLAEDLESGVWDLKHGHLRSLKTMDLGYTFLISTKEKD
jgi:ubiquinone/menaquinone biosynthesis C-methylase UbiE